MAAIAGTRGLTPWYPKRSRSRWREGAPDFVCDVFDNPAFADRYTVFLTGPAFVSEIEPRAPFIAMSDAPTHPQGISVWGEMLPHEFAAYRYRNGKRRVRWLDLPEHIRAHVFARAVEC